MPLNLFLNGNARTFSNLNVNATVDLLVLELGLKTDRVAVELNGVIAARSEWSQTRLAEHDRLEVVHFVGGGRL